MADIQVSNAPFINKWFYVTGAFGEQRTDHIHTGLDLAPAGFEGNLYAIDTMTIIARSYDPQGYGYYIICRNNDTNVMYLYSHMFDLSDTKPIGYTYARNEYVGKAGRSGEASGVHLHLAMQYGSTWNFSSNINDYINPTTYLTDIQNIATYGTRYYYNGTIPPTPTPTPTPTGTSKSKFPWFIYFRKRNENL